MLAQKGTFSLFPLDPHSNVALQFLKTLVNETAAHRYGVRLHPEQLSLIWSFIVSVFCIGGLLGSLVAAPLIARFGRWVRGAGRRSAALL